MPEQYIPPKRQTGGSKSLFGASIGRFHRLGGGPTVFGGGAQEGGNFPGSGRLTSTLDSIPKPVVSFEDYLLTREITVAAEQAAIVRISPAIIADGGAGSQIIEEEFDIMGVLGDFATNALTAVLDYQVQRFTSPPPVQQVRYAAPAVMPQAYLQPVGALSEGYDAFKEYLGGDSAVGTTTSEVVIDNATGQCVGIKKKKRRRRRRRLATPSDIKDLAALQAVLGKGAALKEYLATHGRR